MKKNVRKKDPNSTNSTGLLPLYNTCAQTSGIIIYSDGRTNGKMNSKIGIETEKMLLLSSSFLLQLFKTKSPKIASWPGILVCHKETRIKVVLARKLGKQGHGSSPVLFQYIHWPVPRGRGTGRFPPARHWSVNVIKQDNHQSPYFQLEIPFGSTKISGINKVYTFIWNDFWTLRNFWRSSIQFLIPRIIVRISLIFSRWTIGNDCLFSRSRSIYRVVFLTGPP